MRCVKSWCLVVAGGCLALQALPAEGAYVLTPVKSGTSDSTVTVNKGSSFAVDFMLSSNATPTPDSHNSAIFQGAFSTAGLTFETYQWKGGYVNATGPLQGDDSRPNVVDQGDGRPVAPTTITAATVSGAAIDFEMSNTQVGLFTTGNLVTVTFGVPAGWSGPSSLSLSAVPDEFALNGFTVITTTAGTPLTIQIVPEPATISSFALVALYGLARRRRD